MGATAVGKNVRRIGAAGFIAATATLLVPLSAQAEERPEVLAGDCGTFVDGTGEPVKLDLAALAKTEGKGVGLTDTGKTDEQGRPVVTVPTNALLGKIPVLGEALGGTTELLCEPLKGTVNTVAAPVQEVAGTLASRNPENPEDPGTGEPDQPGPGEPEQPGPTPSPEPEQPAPGEDAGSPSGGGEVAPVTDDDPTFDRFAPTVVDLGAGLNGLNPNTVPVPPGLVNGLPPVQAPGLSPNGGQPQPAPAPEVFQKDTGTAQAIPNVPPGQKGDRLPQLLAVLALAVAIVALARTWVRRRAS